ncbi:MAG: CcoQ/FixQ family Cbb3-type cytochrome c oxidase assembly chaperone [Pseudomonadota bacterium]
MEINELRALLTLLTFLAFVGVWVWAWSSRRKNEFDQTANQLFSKEEDEMHRRSALEIDDE